MLFKSFTIIITFLTTATTTATAITIGANTPPAPAPSPRPYPLPQVEFSDLLMLTDEIGIQVAHDLITLGGIQIVNIPKFHEARETALNNLAECLQNDPNSVQSLMNDGSKRLSTGAPNIKGKPKDMISNCGSASKNLRILIDTTTQQLMKLLDGSRSTSAQQIMTPYETFIDLAQNGDHLEHLHSYYSANERSLSSSKPLTMDLHTDSGLFIAMTNGFYRPNSAFRLGGAKLQSMSLPSNGLYIQLPTGEVVEAVTEPDSLIFMVGQGSSDWLSPVLGAKLRPLPHALSADLSGGWTRSWYGKMYLPPQDAWLPEFEGSKITYGNYRTHELTASKFAADTKATVSSYLPAACGMMSSNHLLEMVQNTLCDNGDGVMCWQQCYPLSDYPCGAQAECIDTATGEPVDGTIMCPSSAGMMACEVQCPNPKNKTDDDFCWGAGTDMYMDGFTSILKEKDGSTACLNLFFKEWTLNTKTKYAFGCLGVFFLGIIVEYLSSVRRVVYKRFINHHVRNIVLMLLHCSQVCLGYFLMLAAMTYNVEIFCMVLAGVGTGHALFNLKAPPPANTDHCCAGTNDLSELLDDTQGSSAKMTYKY